MIKSAYLDTSVFDVYFDEEFSSNTIPFFERIIDERIQIFVSQLLISELAGTPDDVKELLYQIPPESITEIELATEAINLADK
jgi:predicted nucleic acid-binding protein